MRKLIKYVMYICVFALFSTLFTVQASAVSVSEMKTFIKDEYNGFFMKNGAYVSLRDGYAINFSNFDRYKEFYYGSPGSVDSDQVKGVWRFLGRTSYEDKFLNRDAPPDGCTTGNLKGRTYVTNPFDNKSKIVNSYKPKHDEFNKVSKIWGYFLKSNKTYSMEEVRNIKRSWLDLLDDSYAMDDSLDKNWSVFKDLGCWVNRTNANQWLAMSMSKRESLVHITQIPTEYSYGQFVEFHKAPASQGNRHYYDTHYIYPTMRDNFKATKLELVKAADGMYELFFTVKNDHGRAVTLQKDLPTMIKVSLNGVDQGLDTEAFGFGTVWKKDQSKRVKIADLPLGFDLPEGTEIKVEAKYNYKETVDYVEIGYEDNVKTTKIFTDTFPVCIIGGGSENKLYSYRVTDYDRPVNSTPDEFGYSYVYYPYTICKNEYAFLSHSASLNYNKAKQTLVGTWSLNTKGHSTMNKVPKAFDAKPAEGKYSIEITEPKFKELKINPIRRILRAGRDVSMYSTMDIELSIMSFEGGGDIDSRKEAFKQELINTLKAKGYDLGSGAVKNNNKKDSVKSIVNDDIGISEKSGPLIIVEFGEDSCIKIKRFQREYEISIPIKTKNEGGIQNTNQGDFSSDITYEVSNVIEKFYTDINTKDGLHGLQFETNMDGSKIGPGVSSMLCEAKPERFGIQGNIYDDVRSDETNNHDDDWDF